ncbi:DUF4221 family protein [Chitinophaga sp. Mgbs1]|uniref:DUF4221 family protein n=1 Tax=Chitinophaga solisilvae TaxID=1233460 RepID=A0A433WE46_9BACT|nr:DUF4221 family protein [Chitinophaga solisilvae]
MTISKIYGRILCCAMAAIFCACQEGKIRTWSNCNQPGDSLALHIVFGDTLQLQLDSLMILGITTPVNYEEKSHTFYAYDEYNKRLLSWPLQQDSALLAPDTIYKLNIRQKISWFSVLSPDSLALYCYGPGQLYFYSHRNKGVVRKLDFSAAGAAAKPYASGGAPVYITDSLITGFGFLMGEIAGEKPAGRTICSAVHLPDGQASHHVPYSAVYTDHNWGGAHLRTVFATRQDHTGDFIISLPADHHVQFINSRWEIKDVYAGSRKHACITTMPYSKKNNRMMADNQVALDYYFSTPTYRNIIYDRYRERYYRILEWPPVNPRLGKKSWLIAFDSNFKYLGEAPLPEALALDNCFLTSEGLYILNTDNKDPNIAQYVQCKVEI